MILRDPVHGLVAFEGDVERVVTALLNTREVQRLRRVRQLLGLTSLVFPGAEHSRFSHALGACHVMVRLQDRIRAVHSALPADFRLDREAAVDGVAAALLHDVGPRPVFRTSSSKCYPAQSITKPGQLTQFATMAPTSTACSNP